MTGRTGRGSLTGRWAARDDRLPNLRGCLTIEAALTTGTVLWLAGWTRRGPDGCEFVSRQRRKIAPVSAFFFRRYGGFADLFVADERGQ
jgi:hypothetical protein